MTYPSSTRVDQGHDLLARILFAPDGVTLVGRVDTPVEVRVVGPSVEYRQGDDVWSTWYDVFDVEGSTVEAVAIVDQVAVDLDLDVDSTGHLTIPADTVAAWFAAND